MGSFILGGAVGRFGAVAEVFLVGFSMPRIFLGRSFLVEGYADVNECFEGMLLTDDCGGAVVGIEVEEVEESF